MKEKVKAGDDGTHYAPSPFPGLGNVSVLKLDANPDLQPTSLDPNLGHDGLAFIPF